MAYPVIDVDAIAKKYGAIQPASPTDVDAIAAKYGATPAQQAQPHPDPLQRNITRPEDLPSQQEFDASHQAAVATMHQALPEPVRRDQSMGGRPPAPPSAGQTFRDLIQGVKEFAQTPGIPATAIMPDQAKPGASTTERAARGVARGAAQIVEGLSTPENVGLMVGTGPAAGLLGKITPLLPKAISAGFTLQMLGDLARQVPEVADAVKSGDAGKIAESVTKATATAGMAAFAAHGVIKGHPAAEAEAKATAEEPTAIGAPAEEPGISGTIKKGADDDAIAAKYGAIQPEPAGPDGKPPVPEPTRKWTETGDAYLKRLAESSPNPNVRSAADSAETFKAGDKSYADLFVDAEERLKAKQAAADKKGAKPVVPETGIPDHVERVVEARDRLARHLAGKPFSELANPDRLAIDDLVVQGHGFGVYPDEAPIEAVKPDVTAIAAKYGAIPVEKRVAAPVTPVVSTPPTELKAEPAAETPKTAPETPQVLPEEKAAPTPAPTPEKPAQAAQPSKQADSGRPPSVSPAVGRERKISVPGEPDNKYPVRYAVRELSDVHASHQAANFEPNPNYEHTNDHDYSQTGGAERVTRQAQEFDPELMLTDAPTAELGAPLIDERGNVLGGNSRTMTIGRVYAKGGAEAEAYKTELAARAESLGIKPEELARFKQPVLVRETTAADPQKAITDFNKKSTSLLTPEEQAVSDGRRLSSKTVGEISARMGDLGESGTMAEALRGEDAGELLNMLERDGVITPQEKVAYFDRARKSLTPEIKARIAKALVGRFFDEPRDFGNTSPEMQNKLERIAPHALRVEDRPEWSLHKTLREAIAHNEDMRVGAGNGKKMSVPAGAGRDALNDLVKRGLLDADKVDGLLEAPGKDGKQKLTAEGKATAEKLFAKAQVRLGDAAERTYSPEAVRLSEVLNESPRNAEYAFRRYANDAEYSKEGAQAAFFEPPTRAQAFADAFGEPTPDRAPHADEAPMIDFEKKIAEVRAKAIEEQKKGKGAAAFKTKAKQLASDERGSMKLPDLAKLRKKYAESDIRPVLEAAGSVGRSLGSRIKAEGGGAGRVLMNLIEKADDFGREEQGKLLVRIAETRPSRLTKPQRFDVLDAMEGRKDPKKLDADARQVYDAMKEGDTHLGAMATALGVEIKTKNGKRPFAAMDDHYPHVLRPAKDLKSGTIREDVIDNIVRQKIQPNKEAAGKFVDDWVKYLDSGERQQSLLKHLVDSGQAKDEASAFAALQKYRSNIQRHGSLEFARELNLPFYDPDPVRVMPHALSTGAKRLAQIAVFGQDHQAINQAILDISRAGGDADFARKAVDRMIGTGDKPATAEAVMSRFLRGLSSLKMSVSSVRNLTQSLNPIIAADLPSFMAGMKGALPTAGSLFHGEMTSGHKLAIRSGAALDDVLTEATRDAGGGELVSRYLKATGFSATERFNRTVSAGAGVKWAERNLEHAKAGNEQAKAVLADLGIDAGTAIKKGLSERDRLSAARKFSDLTQFRTRPQDLPNFATETELGKVFFQFKSFAYQQARFMSEQTYREFKEGRPDRAMRGALLLGVVFPYTTGELMRAVQNGINGRDDKFKGKLDRWFDDLAQASSSGILMDAVQSIDRGRVAEFIGGPAVTQAKDLGQMLKDVASRDRSPNDKMKAVKKYALSRFGGAASRLVKK